MSSMSARHREMLEYLFDMQGGYLLRFTNDSFRRFMILHANIDVYNASGYDEESSKATSPGGQAPLTKCEQKFG